MSFLMHVITICIKAHIDVCDECGYEKISINDKIRMYKKWKIKMYKIVQN